MRVGITNNYGKLDKIVEMNGVVTISDLGSLFDDILEGCGCTTDKGYDLYNIKDSDYNNNIKKSFLRLASDEIINGFDNIYFETLVISAKTAKTMFSKVDTQSELSYTIYQDLEQNEVTETTPDIKYFDCLCTDTVPDRIYVAYETKADLYNAFRDALTYGFIDTGNAAAIISEYTNLDVVDKHDKYVEAYLTSNKK